MILATHAIVGAAVGRLFDNPWLSLAAGYLSHYALDAIPHSQYHLVSQVSEDSNPLDDDIVIDRRFLGDLILIGTDCIGGFLLALFIFQGGLGYNAATISLLAGAAGGVLPDFLQFLYFKIKVEPLTALQKIHNKIHAQKELHGFTGAASQIAIAVIAIIISKLIK
ncbi:hypothetical protein M1295_00475 [Patescibacteria group bacterium]|nr:hypothetical protein [Patescibacteria group bacterium]